MIMKKIAVGERTRSYEFIAAETAAAGAPLLLALHGTTQRGRTMRAFSGRTLDALAQRIGADLVYLDGHRRAWNDARRIKTSAAQKKNVDDVGFVRAVVERYDRPTIAIGYSNGGQLVHRLLHEQHGLLAGAAIVAAGLPAIEDSTLGDSVPDDIPVILFHGTADPVVPHGGGMTTLLGRPRGRALSAGETAAHYAPTEPAAIIRIGDVERADWSGVRQVTQFGVGHVIPNRTSSPSPRFIGPSHHDLDLGEELQEFFQL